MSTSSVLSPSPMTGTYSLKQALAAHPLRSYAILAFAGTWLLDAPMVLGQDGLGLLPYSVPLPIYILLFLLSSYAGPTLAALLVTAALEGGMGVRAFLRRYGIRRVGIQWVAIALLGYPLLYAIVASLWLGPALARGIAAHWTAFLTVYLPGVFILPGIITWGEEAGWRGFAQTRMQERYGALRASLIVGFLHGVWHLPAFLLVSGPVAGGPFSLYRFAVSTGVIMVVTVIWAWVFNNSGQSILIAVLIHASSDAVRQLFVRWAPGFPGQAEYALIAAYILIALSLVIATRGRLGTKQ